MKRIKSYIDDKMLRPMVWLKTLKSERGQGLVEYALILVLIAVVVVLILTNIGTQVNSVFNDVNNAL